MSRKRETLGLGLLFGAIYFIQGVGEPTEGLIAQPVRSILKSWGHGDSAITTFAGSTWAIASWRSVPSSSRTWSSPRSPICMTRQYRRRDQAIPDGSESCDAHSSANRRRAHRATSGFSIAWVSISRISSSRPKWAKC